LRLINKALSPEGIPKFETVKKVIEAFGCNLLWFELMKRDVGRELLAGIKAIKHGQGRRTAILLPSGLKFDALKDQIEDEPAGLEVLADQQDDYVDFDPADYVDNSVTLARMKAQVKRSDLARHMKVTQSYISKLEHADQVSAEALQKVLIALQEIRKIRTR